MYFRTNHFKINFPGKYANIVRLSPSFPTKFYHQSDNLYPTSSALEQIFFDSCQSCCCSKMYSDIRPLNNHHLCNCYRHWHNYHHDHHNQAVSACTRTAPPSSTFGQVWKKLSSQIWSRRSVYLSRWFLGWWWRFVWRRWVGWFVWWWWWWNGRFYLNLI